MSGITITQTQGPSPATKPANDDSPVNPITKTAVMKTCVDHGFYRTPSCNEKLYLHHRGYDQIADLDEYTETKVLWLEGNALRRIEGLSALKGLRQLYLHQNLLTRIEGLEELTILDSLNLSDNNLSFLSGLDSQADGLTMLQLKNNRLQTIDGLEHLLVLNKLSSLDLGGNRIEDGSALIDLLAQLPELKSLHLTGNPCVRSIKNYRKTVISRLPKLLYLDEKPVFADERRLVTAWASGGLEAEREEKKKMRAEEEAKVHARLEEFRELQRRAREQQGLPPQDEGTDEDTDSDPSGSESGDDHEGDVWVPGSTASNATHRGPDSSTQVSSTAHSDTGSVRGDES
jgi:dynein assembly factor 1